MEQSLVRRVCVHSNSTFNGNGAPLQVFRGISKIIQQCWLHRSEARLTALRVKKNIGNLMTIKTEKKEEQS